MADERMPYQIIDDMTEARRSLSDKKVLAELSAIPPLADEDDPCWDKDDYLHKVAYPYLALWNIVGERQLRAAIPLILDRACFGDPGEIMRDICHTLEGIVHPKYSELTAPCVAALKSPRPGTRMWAVYQLHRLRDPAALPALKAAEHDEVREVRASIKKAIKAIHEEMKEGRG